MNHCGIGDISNITQPSKSQVKTPLTIAKHRSRWRFIVERRGAVLSQYVGPGSILHRPSVTGWRQAVDIAAAPLLLNGAITPEYVEAIKASIAGPGGTYIDLGGGVALAHARPESGVNATALSVLQVETPFLLADSAEHPISTMFCLAAKDANAHIALMQDLAGLLTDGERRGALNAATTADEIRSIFEEER
jgi:PTS system ascorbate-specific IIA component